jgi:hypothetical protein
MSATGQAGGGDAGGQAAGGEAAAPSFDAAALQQQLQQTAGGVDDLRQQFGQFLESAPWQPQQEAEPEQGVDLSFLDEGLYNGDPAFGDAERQQAQQRAQESIQQAIDRRTQEALAPLEGRLQEFQREQKIRDLVAAHPEFQDREVAERIAGPNGLAVQAAEDMGRPDLATDPAFWKLVYMAERASNAANAEGQDGADAPNAALLEGGGGAGPAGGNQVDIADQIIGARRGASVLPYG